MAQDLIFSEVVNDIGTITLNDPAAMNALSPDLVAQFGSALKAFADPAAGVRCLVIRGEGKAFCAGANLKGMASPEERAKLAGTPLQHVYHPLFRRIRDFPAPVITAVNGAAVGAGMSLAMMGDLIIAARSAYFLQAFRNIGVVPDCGSSWLLPRLVGGARARELSLLGNRLPADIALEWGLINRLVDDEMLASATREMAEQIAAGPLASQNSIRRLYWASAHNSFEEQLDLEDFYQERAIGGPEAREGVTAFREKRKADFRKIPARDQAER